SLLGRSLALAGALALPACGGGGGGGSGDGSPPAVQDNPTQVVVEPRSLAELADVEAETGAHVVEQVPGTSYYLVDCPPGPDRDEFRDQLEDDPRVNDV